jgi:hypothetical protein
LRINCLLRQVIEGKIKGGIEVTGRRGRRRRKLLNDLKERRGYSQLKEEALDHSMWKARFGRGFRPVVRQTTTPHRRFGTTFLSHLSTLFPRIKKSCTSLPLEIGSIGPKGCPETWVWSYHSTLRNVPEKCRCRLHSGRDTCENIPENPRRSFAVS